MLDFEFEDKLKKFIEENYNHSCNIVIRKTQAGVEIEEIDTPYPNYRIDDVLEAARDLIGEIDSAIDVMPDEVIDAQTYLEEAIDNLDLDF